MTFTGFSHEAFEFYRNLTEDNSKEFWKRNKEVYERAVQEPMTELAEALSGEFGAVQVLRPQRDSRFSNDKSPYKVYQGAYLDVEPCLGYWVQIDASGLYASGRFYPYDPAEVVRFRERADAEESGAELAGLVARLRSAGFEVGGERLKTRPRGFPADHPRLELLRHRKLDVGRRMAAGPWTESPEPLDRVRAVWRETRPLLDWVSRWVRGAGQA